MTNQHPQRDNMILAADNKDQLFECDDTRYADINYVLQHPELNWRPVNPEPCNHAWVKTTQLYDSNTVESTPFCMHCLAKKQTKKIKRWLWATNDGLVSRKLYTKQENLNDKGCDECRERINMRHKHYDCIVAWASGEKIEGSEDGINWYDLEEPIWMESKKYRIKKEPVIIEEHYKKDSYGRFIWVNSPEGYDLKITYQDGVAIKSEVAE